jgi:hypothetical protein
MRRCGRGRRSEALGRECESSRTRAESSRRLVLSTAPHTFLRTWPLQLLSGGSGDRPPLDAVTHGSHMYAPQPTRPLFSVTPSIAHVREVRVLAPRERLTPASAVVGAMASALVAAGAQPVRPREGRLSEVSGFVGARLRHVPVIVPMMGADFRLLRSAGNYGAPVPFAWDVWEHQWDTWARMLGTLRVPLAIITAQESARALEARCSTTQIAHLPEATNLDHYSDSPARLVDRGIDVLELGRRSDPWHDSVAPHLTSLGRTHLFQRSPNELIFSDASAMHRAFADTKVSVCFPSSTTHPARSGSVTTMTHRYLESIAAGCLVLGESVPELTVLLGMEPVQNVDWTAPARQLDHLLNTLGEWQTLVDSARLALSRVGDWHHRAQSILDLVESVFSSS